MEAIIYRALRNATGRLLFNRLGAIAQFETEIRAERQMDGKL
jgi:DNA invertase Pin-like site-specific DNA recombinase